MNEDFLHILNSLDDSEKPDMDMDWQHMKSILDTEMPVASQSVAPPHNTSLWLKGVVVAVLISSTCLVAILWNNKKELAKKRTAELHISKLSKTPVDDKNKANGIIKTFKPLSRNNIVSDSVLNNTSSDPKTILTNASNKKIKKSVSKNTKTVFQNNIGASNKTTADNLNSNNGSLIYPINKNSKKQYQNKDKKGDLIDASVNLSNNSHIKNGLNLLSDNKTSIRQIIADTSFKLGNQTLEIFQKQYLGNVADMYKNGKKADRTANSNKIVEQDENGQQEKNNNNLIGLGTVGYKKNIDSKNRLAQKGGQSEINSISKPNNDLNMEFTEPKNSQLKQQQDYKEATINNKSNNYFITQTNALNNAGQIAKQILLNNIFSINTIDSIKIENRIAILKKETATPYHNLLSPKNKSKKTSGVNNAINLGFYIGMQQHFATSGQSNDNYGLNGSKNLLQNHLPSFAFDMAKNKWSLELQAAILQPAYLKHQTIKSLDSTSIGPTLVKLFQSPISLQLGYNILSNINIYTGAGISFNQKAILKAPPDSLGNSIVEVINGKDFSGYGLKRTNPFWTVGFNYRTNRFVVGMQYSQGITTFIDYNNISQKPHDLQFFLRYKILKK